jgi:hypothetical protein
MELTERVAKLESQVNDLIKNQNTLLARQTATSALVQVIFSVWGKSRMEAGQEIVRSGAKSLAAVSALPVDMQQEVAGLWNAAYAVVMGPHHHAFQVGEKPGSGG